DCFARLVHRFDVLLKPGRRAHRPELAGGVDYHCNRVGVLRCDPPNVFDETGVIDVRSSQVGPDADNVVCRSNAATGTETDERIKATGAGHASICTKSCVTTMDRIAEERLGTERCVAEAFSVAIERIKSAAGRVILPDGIIIERMQTNTGVEVGVVVL